MSEESDSEKSHEPSEKRLQDARKKGQVARSAEATTAVAYGAYVLGFAVFGAAMLQQLGSLFLVAGAHQTAGITAGLRSFLGLAVGAVLPILLLPALATLLSSIAQRNLLFTAENLRPKLDRISLLKNAKKKFGLDAMVDFLRNFAKMLALSGVLVAALWPRMGDIPALIGAEAGTASSYGLDVVKSLFFDIFLVSLCFGAVDLLWQHNSHRRRLMMSHKELMDEMKESEGDPHFKHARRSKGQEIVMQQIAAEVPKADVIIVNPTHYAVALAWSRKRGEAPKCLAKGVDEVAARIREIAQANGIPIHSDPPTARALYASVPVGHEIAPEHYKAVAVAVRFAENMRKKARAWR